MKDKLIHGLNLFTKKNDCDKKGKGSLELEEINCIDCLTLMKKEWQSQVTNFSGHPKVNAVNGLKRTIKRIGEVL